MSRKASRTGDQYVVSRAGGVEGPVYITPWRKVE